MSTVKIIVWNPRAIAPDTLTSMQENNQFQLPPKKQLYKKNK